jgi:spore maturation protein CgeB
MRCVIFTHSLVSDWNHGNAHFLRGIVTELTQRGHDVRIFEPRNGWSLTHLIAEHGEVPLWEFAQYYPGLRSTFYDENTLDLSVALDGAETVLVHEWNSHDLVRRVGDYRRNHPSCRLFFHDTHHRSVTDPNSMALYDLRHYDGVLAYGNVIRDLYLTRGWASQAWTWHEAADTRVFWRRPNTAKTGDLVWIGNWGDGERSREIREFFIEPVRALRLKATVYGVRYPRQALEQFAAAGIEYGGWLPNYRVPEVFSRYRATVHIPRGPYAKSLPGIPTIRPFEALACGIPLISAPWDDAEHLFRPGIDFLFARDAAEMTSSLQALLSDAELSAELARQGLVTIQTRHSCAKRTDEFLSLATQDATVAAAHGVQ